MLGSLLLISHKLPPSFNLHYLAADGPNYTCNIEYIPWLTDHENTQKIDIEFMRHLQIINIQSICMFNLFSPCHVYPVRITRICRIHIKFSANQELWYPSWVERPYKLTWVDQRAGQSLTIGNLVRESAQFSPWDGVILVIHRNWEVWAWEAAPWKEIWGLGWWQVECEPAVCPGSQKGSCTLGCIKHSTASWLTEVTGHPAWHWRGLVSSPGCSSACLNIRTSNY